MTSVSFQPDSLPVLARRLPSIKATEQTGAVPFCQIADALLLENGMDYLHLTIQSEGRLIQEIANGHLLLFWHGNQDASFTNGDSPAQCIGNSCALLVNVQKTSLLQFDSDSVGELLGIYIPVGWHTLILPVSGFVIENLAVSSQFLINAICSLAKKQESVLAFKKRSYLYQLLYRFFDRSQYKTASDTIEGAKLYLLENLDQPFPGLKFLADTCHVSISTLKNKFQEQEQTPPLQFFLMRKMQYAQELLCQGLSVNQAANRLSYMNTAQFTKAFKRQFGISPMSYVQQIVRKTKP